MASEIVVLLRPLVLTLLLECGLATLLGLADLRSLELVGLAQCLTNPLVVAAAWMVDLYVEGTILQLVAIVALELGAAVVEAKLYAGYLKHEFWNSHALALSVALNAFSFLVGLVILSF